MGRIFKRDGRWAIDYLDHRGRRIRKIVSTDKSVAQRTLANEMSLVDKRRAGMLLSDPKEAARPIAEHIGAYILELQRRGRDKVYVYNIRKHLENAAFAQDWKCVKEITAKDLSGYLNELAGDGRSPLTVNQHRADLSAFLVWCVRQGAAPCNPCDEVAKTTVKQEKKRRALTVEECRGLIKAAPKDRATCYTVLLYTGLRRAEAAALTWGLVKLDVANPYIELPAEITKSGKGESVPLAPEAAQALRGIRRRASNAAAVFPKLPTMKRFRADLAAAGIAAQDERGRKVVLHSLRHSLATMLAQSQVPPAVAMKIMRHRDIKLTLEVYTDAEHLPAAAAVASLPSLTGAAS